MRQILTAIYSRYNADATLKAAIPGGLHFELAPQGTVLSYATYNMITGRPDYMLAGRRFEVCRIQFDIYSNSNINRLTAYEALRTLYDDCRPAATGYHAIIMERVNQVMLRDGSQNELYRAIVEYDCRFLKI